MSQSARLGRLFQLGLLGLAGTGAVLAGRAVSPLQETMRAALSLSDNQMAVLQGPALALPVALAAVPLGVIIDRSSRVRLLGVFVALGALGSMLTAFASNFAILVLGRSLVGLAMTAIIIASFSLLADLYPPAQRGRAQAFLVLGQYGGASFAFAAGGALLDTFQSTSAWRWALLWLTGPPLLVVLILIQLMREPARTGAVMGRPSFRESFLGLMRYRWQVVPLLMGLVLTEIMTYAIILWGAPMLSRGFGLSSVRVGSIMGSITLVSGVVGPICGGLVADFCQRTGGPRRTMATLSGFACLCAPLALFGVSRSITTASMLLLVCISLVAATIAMGVTLFTIVIPNELRGVCLATLSAGVSLFCGALTPVGVSLLAGTIGGPLAVGQSLTAVCMGASLIAAAVFALGRGFLSGQGES